jgi:small multidrug resistance family-3 protein
MSPIILLAAFPLELLALFAIWNWRLRSRSVVWLLAGCAALLGLAALPVVLRASAPSNVYVAFGGMYLVSALAWSWRADALSPRRWQIGEAGVAVMAAAMFAVASAT